MERFDGPTLALVAMVLVYYFVFGVVEFHGGSACARVEAELSTWKIFGGRHDVELSIQVEGIRREAVDSRLDFVFLPRGKYYLAGDMVLELSTWKRFGGRQAGDMILTRL